LPNIIWKTTAEEVDVVTFDFGTKDKHKIRLCLRLDIQ